MALHNMCHVTHKLFVTGKAVMRPFFTKCALNVTHKLFVMRLCFTKCVMSLTNYL